MPDVVTVADAGRSHCATIRMYAEFFTSLRMAPACPHMHASLVQVKNNYIESYGPALQLGSNVFAPTPFNYPDMNSISFTGNIIVNSQFGTVIIESASSVTLSNTQFRNVMCRRVGPRSAEHPCSAVRVRCCSTRCQPQTHSAPLRRRGFSVPVQQPADQHARVLLANPLHAHPDERRDGHHAQRQHLHCNGCLPEQPGEPERALVSSPC